MSDTVILRQAIVHLETALKSAELLKEKIYQDAPYSIDLDTALAKIELIYSRESDYKVFERILDEGIEIIGDNELKNEIQHYYEDSKMFTRFEQKPRELLLKLYPKYFVSYQWRVAAKPADFEQLKNLNEFKIALDYCSGFAKELIRRTTHRNNLAQRVLEMLNVQITLNESQLANMPYIKTMPRDSL